MKHLSLIALLLLVSPLAVAAPKMTVWIQADMEQPYVLPSKRATYSSKELQDSADDILRKFKSKVLELAPDAESADVVITVVARFYAPSGDYFVDHNTIGDTAPVEEGGKPTVQVMVSVPKLDVTRFISGQAFSWTGAANSARKNAEKWLKKLPPLVE